MAKKKRGAPEMPCPNITCGKMHHPRKKICPHCQHERTRVAKPVRKAAKPKASDPIDYAVAFVTKCGGLRQAKKLMERLERIKGLPS